MSKNKNAGSKVAYDNGKRKEGEGRGYVRYKCPPTKTLQDVLRQRPGWLEGQDEEWDFHWCDVGWLRENYGHAYLEDHVRICHFGNHYELTRKNLMGRGIFLFRRLKDVTDWRRERGRADEPRDEVAPVESSWPSGTSRTPYLISGRKFDLRVYVLVTSYRPLKAWLYRDGFARFSGTRFSLASIRDQYAHLTNVAVQCTAPDYDPERGCKWQLQQLRRYLTARHGARAVEALFGEIDNIFVRSLQSVQKGLKPWLIEVNASPSLNATCQQDYELKCRLLEDTLNVVDMEGRLTGREAQVGGFDLMWSDGPVYREDVNPPASGSPSAAQHAPGLLQ
ncbi:hypothetical protein AAFF_G00233470 [Aldrovandia affinis]|uniref:Tubulin--tyrosine ligase-like protein 9 n=1 Tax=Aldrovandia affinis TaxID=143900 RepID=A0AAD7QZV8_9TELE|nr:hypothetical protein AAFF_G00233470 [Aldrovandia affinis]